MLINYSKFKTTSKTHGIPRIDSSFQSLQCRQIATINIGQGSVKDRVVWIDWRAHCTGLTFGDGSVVYGGGTCFSGVVEIIIEGWYSPRIIDVQR